MARAPLTRALALLALLTALPACGAAGDGDDGRLRLVTTVAPLVSIVAEVAGDLARVEGLVPEGTDSHTFEPAPSAARSLARADVVFLNGLGLEEPLRRLAEANRRPSAEVVALGDAVLPPADHLYDFSFPREGGRPNPHLWTSPPLARAYGAVVADTLARRLPEAAGTFRANFERWAARVDELDRAMVAATATVPPARRKLLTYHDAYAYFARHYGWTVVGAIQPADFREPTPREVAELTRQIREQGVPAIFGSEVFPSPVLEQLGRATGARYVDVLRDDDLPGDPGDPGHSWLGLMRFNFVTIVEAMGGDAAALRAVPDGGGT